MSNVKALIRVLTGCDIQCRHCYMSSGDFKNEQFTYNGLETVVDRLTDYDVEVIVFTGGQPTLIGTELIDIIGYSSKKREETGYPAVIEITTNSGIGKDEATANYWLSNFAEAGLDRVRLSVDEYHREFLPEEFEERIIDAAELYGVAIKLMDVAGVEKQIDTNIDTGTRKTFALRPGGRAFSDDLVPGWDNTPRCRVAQAYNGEKERISIFVHPTGDVYTCNVGVPKELSLGNIFVDDLETILYGPKGGVLDAVAKGDVAGLGRFLGLNDSEVRSMVASYGRCGACSKMRESVEGI